MNYSAVNMPEIKSEVKGTEIYSTDIGQKNFTLYKNDKFEVYEEVPHAQPKISDAGYDLIQAVQFFCSKVMDANKLAVGLPSVIKGNMPLVHPWEHGGYLSLKDILDEMSKRKSFLDEMLDAVRKSLKV